MAVQTSMSLDARCLTTMQWWITTICWRKHLLKLGKLYPTPPSYMWTLTQYCYSSSGIPNLMVQLSPNTFMLRNSTRKPYFQLIDMWFVIFNYKTMIIYLNQGSNMEPKHVVDTGVVSTILTLDCTAETAKWSMGALWQQRFAVTPKTMSAGMEYMPQKQQTRLLQWPFSMALILIRLFLYINSVISTL